MRYCEIVHRATIKNDSGAIYGAERAVVNLATSQQQQNVYEGRLQLSQGWYTGSTPVRAATSENCFIKVKLLTATPSG
jgi:hypothetical protein